MNRKCDGLRALVSERLTAAAEEIFALVERTIAEYEEELCHSKEENQRKQHILDLVLSPQVLLHTTDVQIHSSPESSLKQEIPETPQIKEEPEEQSVKREEEQLPPFTAVCVKSEESSLLLHLPQQRQTEHREETQRENWETVGGNISFEPHGKTYKCKQTGQVDSSDTDDEEDWEPPASTSTAQMETEADGDHDNQVRIKDTSTAAHNSTLFTKYKSAPETSATVRDGHTTETEAGQRGKHECPFCKKRLTTKHGLEMHTRVHTGEKPYRCSICNMTFTQKPSLDVHMRRHTGERPYSCSVCLRAFADPSHFRKHKKIHTGERLYSCSVCNKTFHRKDHLGVHIKSHSSREGW